MAYEDYAFNLAFVRAELGLQTAQQISGNFCKADSAICKCGQRVIIECDDSSTGYAPRQEISQPEEVIVW